MKRKLNINGNFEKKEASSEISKRRRSCKTKLNSKNDKTVNNKSAQKIKNKIKLKSDTESKHKSATEHSEDSEELTTSEIEELEHIQEFEKVLLDQANGFQGLRFYELAAIAGTGGNNSWMTAHAVEFIAAQHFENFCQQKQTVVVLPHDACSLQQVLIPGKGQKYKFEWMTPNSLADHHNIWKNVNKHTKTIYMSFFLGEHFALNKFGKVNEDLWEVTMLDPKGNYRK